jgi:hypothetical protein
MNQKILGLVPLCFVIAMTAMATAYANTPVVASNHEVSKSAPIPMDQLGAVAGKQYQGDGLSVSVTPDGARLRCAFQRLEGQVTREGLWLSSTADGSSGERFRVMAMEVGRITPGAPLEDFSFDFLNPSSPSLSSIPNGGEGREEEALRFIGKRLPHSGIVNVTKNVVRFIRPGLTEEYSVSVDGVRQDFIIEQRPNGDGELRVELDVTGARAEPLANGARLVLDSSGRRIAYNRLRVTDARGLELSARLDVPDATRLAVVVDDADAVYPVRIDPTFSDADWVSMGGVPGANNYVYAALADGAGNLYIGGEFTVAGNIIANRIAKWNGSEWSTLGAGMNSTVLALAMLGSDLYAGGQFTTATNSSGVAVTANFIAKWNGNEWSTLGTGMNNNVDALAILGSDVYAGGQFTTATNSGGGAVSANFTAKWNGSSWSALGLGVSGRVRALAVSGTDVYMGGDFATATNNGGAAITVNRMARWDGGNWSALGSGMNNIVYALATMSNGNVYAGGLFTMATNSGGIAVAANCIAKWDGSGWSALGLGVSDRVRVLTVSGTNLYAGGNFVTAGGVTVNYIAKWNGNSWSSLGSGMSNHVAALVVSDSSIYAGGLFIRSANSVPARYVAKWNGSSWSALGSGIDSSVYALAVSGTNVYAGGFFTVAGGITADYIAKWNGSSWSALGSGVNANVLALAVSGADLYLGGEFTVAGGTSRFYLARWNGSGWWSVGSPGGVVRALATTGNDLYAGGDFALSGPSFSLRGVGKWNGSSWSGLGLGVNNSVHALAVSGSDVYAGGLFNWATNTGGAGVRANYIAKWDGSSWSALGAGMNGSVRALAVSGSDVYAGGTFTWVTNSGGAALRVNYIAKWDGNNWSALGSGMNFWVYALAVSGSDLYAGGWFARATNSSGVTVPANYVAKWDGNNWSALGSGIGGTTAPVVHALAASGNTLYVGGTFTTAGGKVSGSVALLAPSPGRFSELSYSPFAGFSCMFLDATIGQSYRIQTSPSLSTGNWTDFTNFTYTAPIVITDASALSGTNKFFRAITP